MVTVPVYADNPCDADKPSHEVDWDVQTIMESSGYNYYVNCTPIREAIDAEVEYCLNVSSKNNKHCHKLKREKTSILNTCKSYAEENKCWKTFRKRRFWGIDKYYKKMRLVKFCVESDENARSWRIGCYYFD